MLRESVHTRMRDSLGAMSATPSETLLSALKAASAAAFVRSMRETVPLETMKASLSEQEKVLGAALTNTMQVNFPALHEVVREVGTAEERLRKLCDAIEVNQSNGAEFAGSVQSRLFEFQAAMDEREALIKRSNDVRLLRRLIDAVSNLEHLNNGRGAEPGEKDKAAPPLVVVSARARRLVRSSGEYSRIWVLQSHASHLPGAQRLLERIAMARTIFLEQLCECLGQALEIAEMASAAAAEGKGGEADGGAAEEELAPPTPPPLFTPPPGLGRRDRPPLDALPRLPWEPPLSELAADGATPDAVPAPARSGAKKDRPETLLDDVLWAFGQSGAEDEAGCWVRDFWVTPRLLPSLEAAARAGASLGDLADSMVSFVKGPAFAPLARADARGRPPLHLVCAGVWVAWCRFVGDKMGHTFGAGIPDTFHNAFSAVERVICELEIAALPKPRMRRHLRMHAATAAVRKRFNLPIYYQLRVVEVSKPLEAALAPGPIQRKQPTPAEGAEGAEVGAEGAALGAGQPASVAGGGGVAGFGLPPSPQLATIPPAALVTAVRYSLSSEVILPPLCARFMKLTLQCVARFDHWLASMLPSEGGAAQAASDRGAAGALADSEVACALYFDMQSVLAWLETLAPRLPRLLHLTPAAAAVPALVASSPAPFTLTAELGSNSLEGVTKLEAECNGALVEGVTKLEAECNGALVEGVTKLEAECIGALVEGVTKLRDSARRLRGQLVTAQAAACEAQLAPVRAIPASYRMTGKGMPTHPSFFVAQVLGPLRGFMGASEARLDEPARSAWAVEVATLVTEQYCAIASSTLDTVRKNEQALLRLNAKKQSAGAGAAAGVSDSYKICVQMCLDVQAYGEELAAVGVPPLSLSAFAKLQDEVRPPDDGTAAPLTDPAEDAGTQGS